MTLRPRAICSVANYRECDEKRGMLVAILHGVP